MHGDPGIRRAGGSILQRNTLTDALEPHTRDTRMSKLHLVFGGRVKDPRTLEFADPSKLEVVGIFADYASAEKAWRANAQRTVDDAEMKFVVVHLHRLLEPELLASPTA
jgi:hypothetical protein